MGLLPESELFDPKLLEAGHIPADLPLDGGRVVFLWQAPRSATLGYLRNRYHDTPILVGRFEAETPVYEAGMPYWAATDFFDLRTMMGFELATTAARQAWRGPPEPAYLGMSLIDGDLPRLSRWFELVACVATLLQLRRKAPHLEVVGDWMGVQLAEAVGLRTRRLWRADWADPNWPIRRWFRERFRSAGTSAPGSSQDVFTDRAVSTGVDVVFLLGGWVETRLLDSFPIEALSRRGRRCRLWVTRRSESLDALIARTGVGCELLPYPPAAEDVGDLQRQVAAWCDQASAGGYFAPLRGEPALRVVRLMAWPRWAPKLVAMHRLLSDGLERERPRLLIGPAEKDWPAYCGHHAARQLGIPSVGFRHGAWPAGSYAERYDHRYFFPPAPRHIMAYTPGDAVLCQHAHATGDETVLWRGNLRLDKHCPPVPDSIPEQAIRILIATHGTGPGSPTALRKRTRPLNVQLIAALFDRLGDRVCVRAHPWDSQEHFPPPLRPLFLPQNEDLDSQLARSAAVVTTYSTIALDAAAAGRPVFLWDYAQLDYLHSEMARTGAVTATVDLGQLCETVARFVEDSAYRRLCLAAAARFPEYLRQVLPDPTSTMSSSVCQRLESFL